MLPNERINVHILFALIAINVEVELILFYFFITHKNILFSHLHISLLSILPYTYHIQIIQP